MLFHKGQRSWEAPVSQPLQQARPIPPTRLIGLGAPGWLVCGYFRPQLFSTRGSLPVPSRCGSLSAQRLRPPSSQAPQNSQSLLPHLGGLCEGGRNTCSKQFPGRVCCSGCLSLAVVVVGCRGQGPWKSVGTKSRHPHVAPGGPGAPSPRRWILQPSSGVGARWGQGGPAGGAGGSRTSTRSRWVTRELPGSRG